MKQEIFINVIIRKEKQTILTPKYQSCKVNKQSLLDFCHMKGLA